MSYENILPDVNICNIKSKAKERKCGGEYGNNTEKLIYDVLSEIKKCVGSTSIYREFIVIQLQDMENLDNNLYPNVNIIDVIYFLNMKRGFHSSIIKNHSQNCRCEKDDPPCTKWLKIENTWD